MANSDNKINIGDSWKSLDSMQININDTWKDVGEAYINIGDSWKQFYSAGIIIDGLILNLDVADDNSLKYPNKLLDDSTWTPAATAGNNSIGQFTGWSTGNTRVQATDPWGNLNIVWKTSTQNPVNAQYPSAGGIYCATQAIDKTKMYRVSYWERRVTNNAGIGKYYFGCNGYGTTNGVYYRNTGTLTTNPYFFNCSYNHPYMVSYNWFLIVGHLWPAGSGIGSNHNDSGIYTISNGKLGDVTTDFVSHNTTTTFRPRTLAIYRGSKASMVHHSLHPRLDLCDGNEPSVQELLDNVPNTLYDLSSSNNDFALKNSPVITNDQGGGIVFDAVKTYVVSKTISYTPRSLSFWLYNNLTIDTGVIGGPSTYQTLLNFDGIYNNGINLGAWTGAATNETVHIWATNSSMTYIRDVIPIGYHNFVFNWNGTTYDIWIDGDKKTTYSNNIGHAVLENYNSQIHLGWNAGNYYFYGYIYSFIMYENSLSDNQVLQNFNVLRGRFGI
jgi:hypothetical protein